MLLDSIGLFRCAALAQVVPFRTLSCLCLVPRQSPSLPATCRGLLWIVDLRNSAAGLVGLSSRFPTRALESHAIPVRMGEAEPERRRRADGDAPRGAHADADPQRLRGGLLLVWWNGWEEERPGKPGAQQRPLRLEAWKLDLNEWNSGTHLNTRKKRRKDG